MNPFTEWQENHDTHFIEAVFGGLLISPIIFIFTFFIFDALLKVRETVPFFLLSLFLAALGWIITSFLIFNHGDGFAKNCISKFFYSEPDIAHKIVLNMLNTKNFPYKLTEKEIVLDSVKIRIGKGSLNRGRIKGSIIAIAPYNINNKPLIASLTKKIDEAFLPQGLNSP